MGFEPNSIGLVHVAAYLSSQQPVMGSGSWAYNQVISNILILVWSGECTRLQGMGLAVKGPRPNPIALNSNNYSFVLFKFMLDENQGS